MPTKKLLIVPLIVTVLFTACTAQVGSEETSLPTLEPDSSSTVDSTPTAFPHPFAGETAWITYQTNRTGSEGVWIIHPDGTDDHQINANDMTVLLPDWSPDGRRLVVASRGGDTEPIYEYDFATETFRQLFACEEPCLGDDEPAYSSDGTKVVFVRAQLPIVYSDAIGDDVPGDCSLWIGDVTTGEVTQITSNPACDREYLPRWSPDGKQIVYTRDPFEDGKPTGTAVHIINADGSGERRLTDPVDNAGEADWSPDEEWIVFATYPLFEYNSYTPATSNLYRIHPDGSGLEQLTFNETTDQRATQPRYTPDGKWIIFTAVTQSSRSLWVIPAEGGAPIVIAQGGIYTHGSWQPQLP